MMWVGEEVDIPKTFHQVTPGPSSLRTNLSPPPSSAAFHLRGDLGRGDKNL